MRDYEGYMDLSASVVQLSPGQNVQCTKINPVGSLPHCIITSA
jgi:hypothetical protein